MRILQLLRSTFHGLGGNSPLQTTAEVTSAPGASGDGFTQLPPVYPPRDPGLPLQSAQQLLDAQSELINRLRIHAANPDRFQARFVGPITRVAQYVSSIPATREGLFAGPGGLFRASLELGFAAFQAADGRIFSIKAGVEERHLMEARWRYVCFIAGLLWPLGTTLERVKLTNAKGETWIARIKPVLDWSEPGSLVYCGWPAVDVEPGPSPTASHLALDVMGHDNAMWLESASQVLVTAVLGVSSGYSDSRFAVAHEVVSSLWKGISKIERDRQPQAYGRLQYGSHLGPHLLDILHRLISTKRWTLGHAPLFVDATGIYLQWPHAAADISACAAELQIAGLPSSAAGLQASMEDAGLIEKVEGDFLVEIADDDGELCAALRLARPTVLVNVYAPAAYAKSRKVLLSSIVKADPLVKSEAKAAVKTATVIPSTGRAVVEPPSPGPDPFATVPSARVPTDADEDRDSEDDDADDANPSAQAMEQEVVDRPVSSPPTASSRPSRDNQKDVAGEAPEVSYYDRIPAAWKSQIKRREGEVLGRLIDLWNAGERGKEFFDHPNGCAVSMSQLASLSSNPPEIVMSLGKVGILYAHPSTPGRLMHDLSVPDGAKKRPFFVIAELAAKSLGMKK